MKILMYTILSNWILINLGALNEGVNILKCIKKKLYIILLFSQIAFEFILVLKALMRLLGA
ncbi:hypothetical protein GLOIN_2v1712380 [Rhizophagus irregularis DAOM 181602=DAOM 197198]|uniref:Uncharacterized protein n=1 Tax=Rhizophagus irregularis (strain DAOM 181602 / DAOM 197198 / MUCL 43194) TaxID=747089 RepID=A0A2P4P555_RHIID|nr:hypothetical protein GLOIN_2v1712380 [Rhizophagus irregularis DAOM 181602=DAOM 197198]POG60519.1 hypothetical protein GLOIN_2v1712380 [Rhizophagus irregularis DAOM 181602=DAOM 197198]|eukprot:XP_025167385.1 hypothetical protein GLOIN_2v1712380 [Rhizophagus irregularis DAOM 181602=DAOM 197198]